MEQRIIWGISEPVGAKVYDAGAGGSLNAAVTVR
jgi:hypothetical protein